MNTTFLINASSFFLVSLAFIVGAKNIFIKPVSYFYKICICAVGCYALSELYSFVNAICLGGYSTDLNINIIGLLGCFCFFISSNVDIDTTELLRKINKKPAKIPKFKIDKAHIFAFLVFLTLSVCFIFVVIPLFQKVDLFRAVVVTGSYFPLLVAVYNSCIAILNPKENFRNIKNYKSINVFIIAFLLLNFLSLIVIINLNWFIVGIINLLSVLFLFAITILVIQGGRSR